MGNQKVHQPQGQLANLIQGEGWLHQRLFDHKEGNQPRILARRFHNQLKGTDGQRAQLHNQILCARLPVGPRVDELGRDCDIENHRCPGQQVFG